MSIEEMREAILGSAAVRCDQPAFVLLGLSMAGWNALYASAMAMVTGWTWWRLRTEELKRKRDEE